MKTTNETIPNPCLFSCLFLRPFGPEKRRPAAKAGRGTRSAAGDAAQRLVADPGGPLCRAGRPATEHCRGPVGQAAGRHQQRPKHPNDLVDRRRGRENAAQRRDTEVLLRAEIQRRRQVSLRFRRQ